MTSVEGCEIDPDLAVHINAEIAGNVAIACAKRGVKLVYISTDHLFNGKTPLSSESSPVCPLNTYGRTKAEGEKRVLNACPDALILRTNFFGWGPTYRKSFSDLIVESLRKKQQIKLFTDVFFTPIIMPSLIQAAHELCEINATGILNLVGDERISKHEFGVRLAKAFGLDVGNILAIRLADRTDLVKRPFDLSLSNRKVCQLLGRPIGDVNSHITQLLASDPSYASVRRSIK
jgi:dTDP-4-dehydrorhamnose reductase